jgi:hypothetical protein
MRWRLLIHRTALWMGGSGRGGAARGGGGEEISTVGKEKAARLKEILESLFISVRRNR